MKMGMDYQISINELFQFNTKSCLKILQSKGQLILERLINSKLKVKVYSFFGKLVQVFESFTNPKEYRIEAINNSDWLDLYLDDIKLNQLGL